MTHILSWWSPYIIQWGGYNHKYLCWYSHSAVAFITFTHSNIAIDTHTYVYNSGSNIVLNSYRVTIYPSIQPNKQSKYVCIWACKYDCWQSLCICELKINDMALRLNTWYCTWVFICKRLIGKNVYQERIRYIFNNMAYL